MRGDGVGVGDVGEVPGGARGSGHAAGGDDGGGAGREHDGGMVGGQVRGEHDAATEPSGDGIGVDDGAWIEHGACRVHGTGTGGGDGMRGDGVGVGDVGEVPGGARGGGHAAGGDDGGGAGREHDGGMVGGQVRGEHDAATEPSRDGIGVDDGAWIEHGACRVHGTGTGGGDRMRGDGVGVGYIGAVPGGARGPGYSPSGDYRCHRCSLGIWCIYVRLDSFGWSWISGHDFTEPAFSWFSVLDC